MARQRERERERKLKERAKQASAAAEQPSKRHKPAQRDTATEATPYAILRAHSNLQQLIPLVGDQIPLATEAFQLLQSWTASLWGEPIPSRVTWKTPSHGTPQPQNRRPATTTQTTTSGDQQVRSQGTGPNQRAWKAGTLPRYPVLTRKKRPKTTQRCHGGRHAITKSYTIRETFSRAKASPDTPGDENQQGVVTLNDATHRRRRLHALFDPDP